MSKKSDKANSCLGVAFSATLTRCDLIIVLGKLGDIFDISVSERGVNWVPFAGHLTDHYIRLVHCPGSKYGHVFSAVLFLVSADGSVVLAKHVF